MPFVSKWPVLARPSVAGFARPVTPWAADLDGSRDFSLKLRAFLFQRTVTRNGHAASTPKRMSTRQVHNIMSTVATTLNQAKRPDVKPAKLPIDLRIEMVKHRDDHNKARQNFRVACPRQFDPLLNWLIAGRTSGPLLRRRKICDGRGQPRVRIDTLDDINRRFEDVIGNAKAREVQNDQDRMRLFRGLLLDLGGVGGEDIAKEFKALLKAAKPDASARFYDLRSAVITGLREAGVSEILRHITHREAQSGVSD
ncbi:MAG TPA: hypothetical protein VG326_11690 [Tepidisphaeraceae bacterium]|jgi:hypothetical protein|nr:hypothetical protein [Tepidisphaeraceae bacterium]